MSGTDTRTAEGHNWFGGDTFIAGSNTNWFGGGERAGEGPPRQGSGGSLTTQPDFAYYQGEPLWTRNKEVTDATGKRHWVEGFSYDSPFWQNPYDRIAPLDWARMEYDLFPKGQIDPDRNFQSAVNLAGEPNPVVALHAGEISYDQYVKQYKAWSSARQTANMFLSEFPTQPYWMPYVDQPTGLPGSKYGIPAMYVPPTYTSEESGGGNGDPGQEGLGEGTDSSGQDGGLGMGEGGLGVA